MSVQNQLELTATLWAVQMVFSFLKKPLGISWI